MKIRIVEDAVGAPTAVLCEVQSFDRFCIELPTRWSAQPLAWLGRRAGGYVFVPESVVRELAGPSAGDAAWCSQLESMAAYAESKGWTDADGNLRAHIEMVSEPQAPEEGRA